MVGLEEYFREHRVSDEVKIEKGKIVSSKNSGNTECPKCGTKVEASWNVCPKCGYKLK